MTFVAGRTLTRAFRGAQSFVASAVIDELRVVAAEAVVIFSLLAFRDNLRIVISRKSQQQANFLLLVLDLLRQNLLGPNRPKADPLALVVVIGWIDHAFLLQLVVPTCPKLLPLFSILRMILGSLHVLSLLNQQLHDLRFHSQFVLFHLVRFTTYFVCDVLKFLKQVERLVCDWQFDAVNGLKSIRNFFLPSKQSHSPSDVQHVLHNAFTNPNFS